MSITKKLAASVVVLGLALAGCGSPAAPGQGTQNDKGQTVIRFAWWGNDTRNKLTNEVIAKFEAANPDIKVQGEPGEWSGYWDKLATQVAANDAPDVIQMDEKYISEYGKRGALLDLEKVGLKTDKFMEGTVDTGRVGGKLYGINAGINAPVVVGNPKVLEAANVAMPDDKTWTWETLHQTAKKVSEASPDGVFGTQNMSYVEPALRAYLRQEGKDQFVEGGMGFEPKDLESFFQWGLDIQGDKSAPSDSQTSEDMGKPLDQTMAATNKIGFSVYWSNQITALQKASGTDMTLLRPPSKAGSADKAALWYKASMLWSASGKTKNPEAVAKFVDFLANSPEAGLIMGTERGVPANKEVRSALEPKLSDVDKKVVAYLDSIESELGPVPLVTPVGGGNFGTVQMRMVQDLLFKRKTPIEAATGLHDEVKSQLK
ncbi:carbohydrate ABC transporter substrate-binding protein [Propioniciclava coleopterorum]|uniref:Carbohydrate ABC transporter substrate-binding protein n=1 Tax=Propioniciclava coleopterorum TaxID=2714937 RepID=A0A6G7Y379_9ACTN|nr:ABC transporter substrate-binding protein [Propioniciclava coleopterorum]QIK71081.1 carbohydrate ABC transporter substrate-binding protein [Propioniciclava coleopterorum]